MVLFGGKALDTSAVPIAHGADVNTTDVITCHIEWQYH